MTQRVTDSMLEARIKRLNEVLGLPVEPYTMVDGKYQSNPGNLHLDYAYGGVQVYQMSNEGGGVNHPGGIHSGYVTKRECLQFIDGMLSAANIAKDK
jgi:hypothetical protein